MRASSLEKLREALARQGAEIDGDVPSALSGRIMLRCRAGHRYRVQASSVVYRGVGCAQCAGNARGTIAPYRAWALEQGGVCLSERYANGNTALRFRCARGHEFRRLPRELGNGNRWCSDCRRFDAAEARFRVLRERVERLGYRMLSSEYVNQGTKLEIRCDAGHVYRLRADHIVPGRRCPLCRRERLRTPSTPLPDSEPAGR